MYFLIIDTCGATGTIALASTAEPAGDVAMLTIPGRSASERLIGSIRELCAGRGIPTKSVQAVAVVNGPGSFTGIRVGLSAAKGLCHGLNLPILAISRLAVLASKAEGAPRRVQALLDAGRGEFYSGVYDGKTCIREELLTADEVFRGARERTEVRQVTVCEPAVRDRVLALEPRFVEEPSAKDAVALALAKIQVSEFDDLAGLDANYLRRTDAQLFARPSARKAEVSGSGLAADRSR